MGNNSSNTKQNISEDVEAFDNTKRKNTFSTNNNHNHTSTQTTSINTTTSSSSTTKTTTNYSLTPRELAYQTVLKKIEKAKVLNQKLSTLEARKKLAFHLSEESALKIQFLNSEKVFHSLLNSTTLTTPIDNRDYNDHMVDCNDKIGVDSDCNDEFSLKIKFTLVDTLYSETKRSVRQLVSPILEKMDQLPKHGMYHSCLTVGPWILEYTDCGLCIPRKITSKSAFLSIDLCEIKGQLNIIQIVDKIAQLIVKWNTKIKYSSKSQNNHQKLSPLFVVTLKSQQQQSIKQQQQESQKESCQLQSSQLQQEQKEQQQKEEEEGSRKRKSSASSTNSSLLSSSSSSTNSSSNISITTTIIDNDDEEQVVNSPLENEEEEEDILTEIIGEQVVPSNVLVNKNNKNNKDKDNTFNNNTLKEQQTVKQQETIGYNIEKGNCQDFVDDMLNYLNIKPTFSDRLIYFLNQLRKTGNPELSLELNNEFCKQFQFKNNSINNLFNMLTLLNNNNQSITLQQQEIISLQQQQQLNNNNNNRRKSFGEKMTFSNLILQQQQEIITLQQESRKSEGQVEINLDFLNSYNRNSEKSCVKIVNNIVTFQNHLQIDLFTHICLFQDKDFKVNFYEIFELLKAFDRAQWLKFQSLRLSNSNSNNNNNNNASSVNNENCSEPVTISVWNEKSGGYVFYRCPFGDPFMETNSFISL
ncbi:hypothetical protein ABK040_003554 [Willaertia magna]